MNNSQETQHDITDYADNELEKEVSQLNRYYGKVKEVLQISVRNQRNQWEATKDLFELCSIITDTNLEILDMIDNLDERIARLEYIARGD